MCYSAIVQQNLKKLKLQFNAQIDYASIIEIFTQRLENSKVKISKAFEANFALPENAPEKQIHDLLRTFQEQQKEKLQADLLKQKNRLAKAETALLHKTTVQLLEEQRISQNKINHNLKRLEAFKRLELRAEDSRIFPMYYAPIILAEKTQRVIKLARYHCRPAGKPENIDFKFNGLYNARTDNLGNSFWRELFAKKHAFFVVESFFENVQRQAYEKRTLQANEPDENIVIHFTPPKPMFVACLYDYWTGPAKDNFYSFAALTGPPTPEVREAGHDRLIVALQEKNLESWLHPEQGDSKTLMQILEDPEPLIYEHTIQAP